MAKRKRLTPAQPGYLDTEPPVLETKAFGLTRQRAPIAQVAGDASAAAALQDLVGEVKRARDEGRMIQTLPVKEIRSDYLVRDRMLNDDSDLRALMDSLTARGQQTPIEVCLMQDGQFGLISGWRRLSALRRLLAETGEDRFATVQAILRQPETAADAYIAMIEENEIRVGLSYYERARAAAKAVEQGVFETEKKALLELFSTASRAKRSKIRSFLTLYHAAEDHLRFAPSISERLGLALAKALSDDPARADVLRAGLSRAGATTAEQEIACLESIQRDIANNQGLNKANASAKPQKDPDVTHPVQDVEMRVSGNSVTLKGPLVTEAFCARLSDWLKQQS